MRLRTRIVGMTVVATLALAPASTASAAFPGANGDVAFGRSSQGQVDIWVVFPGVTGTARLTNTPNRNESMPDWNAAGTRLAYSRCAGSKIGNCDIFTMDADGSDVTRLTATPNVQETWPAWHIVVLTCPEWAMVMFSATDMAAITPSTLRSEGT